MGTQVVRNKAELSDVIKKLQGIPVSRPISITIKPWYPPATKAQRVGYFVLVAHIAKEAGSSREEVHMDLRRKFLGYRFVQIDGQWQEVVRSTKTLDANEFKEFAQECTAWADTFLTNKFPG